MQGTLTDFCLNEMSTQVCRICGELKSFSEYYIRTNGKPRTECKACKAIVDAKRRQENPDKNKMRCKERYQSHKVEYSEKAKVYRETHAESICETGKKWRELHKEELVVKKKAYRDSHKDEEHARSRRYRETHQDKLKNYFAQYYREHAEGIRAWRKQYYYSHQETSIEYSRVWYWNNKALAAKTHQLYYKKNAEKIKLSSNKWYSDNKVVASKRAMSYYRDHQEYIKACVRAYGKTPRGIEVDAAHQARRRALGYAPINSKFNDAEYHHIHYRKESGEIDKSIGLYIPYEIHTSIHHNGVTGRNMDLINHAALSWYISNTQTSDLNELALELCKHYNIAVETTA